jgi:hypothetical protein
MNIGICFDNGYIRGCSAPGKEDLSGSPATTVNANGALLVKFAFPTGVLLITINHPAVLATSAVTQAQQAASTPGHNMQVSSISAGAIVMQRSSGSSAVFEGWIEIHP